MNKHLMGSRYFFSVYDDFVGKDRDEIQVIETEDFLHIRQITGLSKCLFQVRKKPSVDEYIKWDVESNVPMSVGKYLIPEFCAEIGFTIADLPKVKSLVDRLDPKHRYEEIIYNSYIENGSFMLTDEQRFRAYKSYKESR